jgi:hypothetical protein
MALQVLSKRSGPLPICYKFHEQELKWAKMGPLTIQLWIQYAKRVSELTRLWAFWACTFFIWDLPIHSVVSMLKKKLIRVFDFIVGQKLIKILN